MTTDCVKYSKGYKYQLQDDMVVPTYIKGHKIVTDFVCLREDGLLWLRKGYATDGVTGISGTPWAWLLERGWLLYASFGHDGLYQLIKLGLLPKEYRNVADRLIERWSLLSGAWEWQANLVYKVVDALGDNVIRNGDREIFYAP